MQENKLSASNLWICVLKGVVTSIFSTLIGVLIFVFIIKLTGLSSGAIRPINQVIKGVSIFIGVLVGVKGRKEKCFLKGLLIGLIYAVSSFILFSILNRSFSLNISFLVDILFLSLMGAISGIICSNILKK